MAGPGERPPQNPVLSREAQARREASRAATKKRRITGSNIPTAATVTGGTYLTATTTTRVYAQPDFTREGGDVERFLRKQPGIRL